MNIERRKVLFAAGSLGIHRLLTHSGAQEIQAITETEHTTFERFGIHDTPNIGGSMNVTEAFKDFRDLGVKWVLAIDPSENFLAAARKSGIPIIIRTFFGNNEFDPDLLKKKLDKYTTFVKNPIIQLFNEVNLTQVETGGREVTPEVHIERDFIPAAKHVIERGGKVLITPVAQRAITPSGITDLDYKRRMNQALANHPDFAHLIPFIYDAEHSYIFSPGENPQAWERRIHQENLDAFGLPMPIFITEKGLSQEQDTKFDGATYAKEVTRMLRMSSLPQIPIASEIFWLYANDSQRPQRTRGRHESFELAAWKTIAGPTPVFQEVFQIAENQRKKELNDAGIIY